jgi:hypothetical protein
VARLYPYLTGDGVIDRPNPLRSDMVPATLSRVIVNITEQVERDYRAVALHAGLVAVARDRNGALQPVAGWLRPEHRIPPALVRSRVAGRG